MHANLSCDFCSSFSPILANKLSWQEIQWFLDAPNLPFPTWFPYTSSSCSFSVFELLPRTLFFLPFNSVIIYSPSWILNMYNSQISFTPLHIHTWHIMFGYVRTYENHSLASLESNLAQHEYFK